MDNPRYAALSLAERLRVLLPSTPNKAVHWGSQSQAVPGSECVHNGRHFGVVVASATTRLLPAIALA